MSNVWLVIEEHEYVASDPVGVFSSKEAAESWVAVDRDHEGTFAIYPLEMDVVRPHWED